MTCHELSDRMPDVVRGMATWSPVEADHLANCADCRAGFQVVSAGVRLAGGVMVDEERLVTNVLQRLRTEPLAPRSNRPLWVVGLAAAAVIALMLLPRGTPNAAPDDTTTEPYAVHIPGLNGLSEEGLNEMLESLDPSWTDTPTIEAPSLDDLDPQELERVQRSWEI